MSVLCRLVSLILVFAFARSTLAQNPSVAKVLADLRSKDRQVAVKAIDFLTADLLKEKNIQNQLAAMIAQLDEEIGLKAAFTLGSIGAPVVPTMRELLKHEDEAVRYRAVTALAAMKSDAKDALPNLIACSRDEDEEVRGKAVLALAKIAPDSDDVRRTLLAALKDRGRIVRFSAWNATAEIGMPMFPELERAVTAGDQSPPVLAAIGAIVDRNKGKDDIKPIARLVPKLVDLLVNDAFPYDSRFGAWQVLSYFHDQSTPLLTKALRNEALFHRDDCSAVLRMIGRDLEKRGENPARQDAIAESMRERLTDHDVLVAQSANNYFFEHSGRAGQAEPQYQRLLGDDDSMKRGWALAKMEAWGKNPAAEAWDRYLNAKGNDKVRAACEWKLAARFEFKPDLNAFLRKNLDHPDLDLRFDVVRVVYPLEHMREQLPEADRLPIATMLLQRLKRKDPQVRYDAMRRLAVYRLGRPEIGAEIAALLNDKHSGVRYYACEALTPCVRAEPKKYVPLVAPLLEERGMNVHWSAAKALGAGGADAYEPFVNRLRKRGPESYWICVALPEIGPKSKDALPTLRDIVFSKVRVDFHSAARRAMATIDANEAARYAVQELRKDQQFLAFPNVKNWNDIDAALQKMAASDDPLEATRVVEAWGHFMTYLHLKTTDPPYPQDLCAKLFPSLRKNVVAGDATLRRRTATAIVRLRDARFREYGHTTTWDEFEKQIEEMLQSRRYDDDLLVRRMIRRALTQHVRLDGV
jgi:HEAT repeat protein